MESEDFAEGPSIAANSDRYVVACVLNWNNYADSAKCIRSLRKISHPEFDVLLIDNGSTDQSLERLEDEFPEIDTIRTGENRGFAGGFNAGIREALNRTAEYVWLVNNDAIVPDETLLGDLVDSMESDEDIGILSPLIMNYPETDRIWFSGGVVDWKHGQVEHEDKNTVLDRNRFEGIVDSDYITYCCPLIRAEVFEAVGYLPEEYFLYYEDVDHSVRANAQGYRLAIDTSTEMYHRGGGSSAGTRRPIIMYYTARARWLFARRFSDRISAIGFVVSYVAWFSSMMLGQVKNGEPRNGVALVRGMVNGIAGKGGKGPYG